MNITEAIDGYSGHEHTLPTFPLQDDLDQVLRAERHRVHADDHRRVRRPVGARTTGSSRATCTATRSCAASRRTRRSTRQDAARKGGGGNAGWFAPSEQYVMKYVSDQVADLVRAGGRAGVGSHGQFQGLGYHWELWNMASGKLTPHEALRIATIVGAEAIGRAKDVGSIEAGKLADMLVLDANPLDNIKNIEHDQVRDEERPALRREHARRGVAAAEEGERSTGSRAIRSRWRTGRAAAAERESRSSVREAETKKSQAKSPGSFCVLPKVSSELECSRSPLPARHTRRRSRSERHRPQGRSRQRAAFSPRRARSFLSTRV